MKITLVYAGVARVGWDSFNKFGVGDDDCWAIPTGLMYLKAVLQQQGKYDVDMIDLRMLSGEEELREKLRRGGSDVVGVSFLTPSRDFGVLVGRIAKEMGKTTLVGGVHASALPEDLASTGYFDAVVVGEGENAILEIMGLIEKGEKLPTIYHTDNFIEDLDQLPFPATAYPPIYDTHAFDENGRMAGIVGSRGCPGRCKYCWPSQFIMYGTKKIRLRSPENVVAEMMFFKHNYDIRRIIFYDDTFTWNKAWLRKFRDYVIGSHIPIPSLAVNARANCFDEEIAGLLKEIGCIGLWFGFESGSPRILQILKKQCTLEQNIKAAKICKEYGFDLNANMLVGIPSETEEDYILSYKFLEQIEPLNVRYNVLSPYPGSTFYEELAPMGLIEYSSFEDFDMGVTYKKGKGIIKNVDYELVKKWIKPFRSFMVEAHLQRRVQELEHRVNIFNSFVDWKWVERIDRKPRLKKLLQNMLQWSKWMVKPILR
ncbi:MAG: radical SAM protein [Candidatus Aureabacteria bacterium]|nr:radical SAM protein [Candidatus Auribacterota bacterium]